MTDGTPTMADLAALDFSKKIYVLEDHVVVNISYEYNIPLSGLKTEAEILGWAHHLTEKTWMTLPALRYFIELMVRLNGLRLTV